MRWFISKLLLLVIILYGVFIIKTGVDWVSEKGELLWTDALVLFLFMGIPVGGLAALKAKIYTPPPRDRRPDPPPPVVRAGDVRTAPVAAAIPSHLQDFVAQGEANIQAEGQK